MFQLSVDNRFGNERRVVCSSFSEHVAEHVCRGVSHVGVLHVFIFVFVVHGIDCTVLTG